MADRYLLESGSPDGYLLEDGSGVLSLETTAVYDPALFAPITQLVASYRNVRDRSLYQDGERKVAQGPGAGSVAAAVPVDYAWFTHEETIRAFAQRAKLSVDHQTFSDANWMAYAVSNVYDPLTMSGWMERHGGVRTRSSLRYQRDTNIDTSWIKTSTDTVAFFPAVVQLSESFRNIRDRSLYQDGEKRISAGNGGSGETIWDPSVNALSYWTVTQPQTRTRKYWSSDAPNVDWIAAAIIPFDPATVNWTIPSHVPTRRRITQMSWTKSGFFVSLYYNPAVDEWVIDSQLVPGGPWWSSAEPNCDWIPPEIRAESEFDIRLRSTVIDSQRVPGKPYWTSQWHGNDWINPELLAEIAHDPQFQDWIIQTSTYKSRAWWSDSPQPQAWMVPSAKFDPTLWPATGLPSHRELPKAKGLWQPDLDNAWQFENPPVPNFFNASFVTNANIVDDQGGSPERSS